MSKHTPGPWEFKNGYLNNDHESNSDKSGSICNARLIAAAPELLEALKGIVHTECPIVTHHRPDCEWCAALKAIRKAEGAA